MGDDQQRAGPPVEIVLDHGQRVDVQVVGRLVQQQHVGLGEQQPEELQPAALTTGQVVEPCRQSVAGEAEVLQQRGRARLTTARQPHLPAQPLHRLQHPLRSAQLGHRLAEIADPHRGATPHPAAVGLQVAGQQPEQAGLTRAVDPDQADALARPDGPVEVAQQHPIIDGETRRAESSNTSLPSRVVAKRCSASRSRGGGSPAISALAASIRNFGFEVRAGGPRRSQASSLRSRFRRRDSASAASRVRSARAST